MECTLLVKNLEDFKNKSGITKVNKHSTEPNGWIWVSCTIDSVNNLGNDSNIVQYELPRTYKAVNAKNIA